MYGTDVIAVNILLVIAILEKLLSADHHSCRELDIFL